MLDSADDQWRIPVIRGNFDNSCALAGELSGSLASEFVSGAAVPGFTLAADVAVCSSPGSLAAGGPAGLTGIFSV